MSSSDAAGQTSNSPRIFQKSPATSFLETLWLRVRRDTEDSSLVDRCEGRLWSISANSRETGAPVSPGRRPFLRTKSVFEPFWFAEGVFLSEISLF